MRTPAAALLAAGWTVLALGCGGPSRPPEAGPPAATGDTLYRTVPSQAGDAWVVDDTAHVVPDSLPPSPSTLVPGFRVQLLSTPSLARAETVRGTLQQTLGAAAYVELRSSTYRIRLGDFRTAAEAESLRVRAVDAGFTGAQVVATLIRADRSG